MPQPQTRRRVRPKYRELVNPKNLGRFLDDVLPPARRAEAADGADYDWHATS